MKKTLALFAVAAVMATQALASYFVVLKDGTQYKAKAKWTMSNGKALVALETGQTLAIDMSLIDVAKSDQVTKLGLGDARIIDLNPNLPEAQKQQTQPSLGSSIRLHRLQNPDSAAPVPTPPPTTNLPPSASGNGEMNPEVLAKFERAYENVGIFEHKLTANGPRMIHVELTADSEDKVFNAISATSFLMVRIGTVVTGAQVDMVELFMKTTTMGSSGRFLMSRTDADALDQKKLTLPDYFVRKVIY